MRCIRSADFCTLSTASNWAKVLTSVRCINFAVLLMSNVHHQRGDVIKGSRMLKNKAQSDQAGDNVSVWWDFLGLLRVPNLRQFDLFDGHSKTLWWKNKPILADDMRLQYNDSWQQCVHTWSQPVRNVSFPRDGPAFGVFSAMFQNAGLNAGIQAWRIWSFHYDSVLVLFFSIVNYGGYSCAGYLARQKKSVLEAKVYFCIANVMWWLDSCIHTKKRFMWVVVAPMATFWTFNVFYPSKYFDLPAFRFAYRFPTSIQVVSVKQRLL